MDPTAQPSQRVLIVEDDDALRSSIVRCLTRANFAVTAVATGADAIDAARRDLPDAAVIDLVLPDAGGAGVAAVLRRDVGDTPLPVLFMTALSFPMIRDLVAPAPVLFKPFTRRQLLDSVREVTRAA